MNTVELARQAFWTLSKKDLGGTRMPRLHIMGSEMKAQTSPFSISPTALSVAAFQFPASSRRKLGEKGPKWLSWSGNPTRPMQAKDWPW